MPDYFIKFSRFLVLNSVYLKISSAFYFRDINILERERFFIMELFLRDNLVAFFLGYSIRFIVIKLYSFSDFTESISELLSLNTTLGFFFVKLTIISLYGEEGELPFLTYVGLFAFELFFIFSCSFSCFLTSFRCLSLLISNVLRLMSSLLLE